MKFVSEYDSDDGDDDSNDPINLVVFFFYLLSLTLNMCFIGDDF